VKVNRISFSDFSRASLATDFMAEFGYMRSFSRAVFENSLQYCHCDSKIFSGDILATSCTKIMKVGPVTPDYEGNKCTFLDKNGKNQPISPNISPTTGLIFNNISALVDVCMGITKPT